MKTEKPDLVQICSPGLRPVIVTREWWIWIIHCTGISPKQVAKEVRAPRSYINWLLSQARSEWARNVDLDNPSTWN